MTSSAPTIELHPAALTRMQEALLASLPRETGGILIGWRDDTNVIVTDALVVTDSKAGRTRYQRRQKAAKKALDAYLAATTNPLVGYVGEWHTHPALSPPSSTDLDSIAAAAAQTDAPVALIVLATNENSPEIQVHGNIAAQTGEHVIVTPAPCESPKDIAMTSNPSSTPRFDLPTAYRQRQEALAAKLRIPATFTTHGTTIGDATEADWSGMLRSFLPARYAVGPIFAVDSQGSRSEQIDLAVYDRQYSPLFFETPGCASTLFVPAECVYAVFEIKQELNAEYIGYAADKIASVRRLYRTSATVYHIDGSSPGKRPEDQPILGGIITQRCTWTSIRGEAARRNLLTPEGDRSLDLGLALDAGAFDISGGDITYSPDGTQLIYFALHLFKRLRPLGTALAPDLDVYEEALSRVPSEHPSE